MNKLILTIFTVAALTLIGCGSGSSSKVVDDTLQTEINIKKRFSYFNYGTFTKDENTTVCHQGLYGDSYKINISIHDTYLMFETSQHRKGDCSDDPFDYVYSSYYYDLGDESTDKTRVNISLLNDSYNQSNKHFEIESMVSQLIFGHIILDSRYYTSVVGSGDIRTQKIKIAFAHASSENNGSSLDSRANDISNYSKNKFYFLEN